jgi:cytochrome b6-f complex iron-sulfur subunit
MTVQLKPPDNSSDQSTISRRQFLELVWKGLLGLASAFGIIGMIRYFSYEPDPAPPTQFDLGPADQYPLDSVTVLNKAEAVLIHSATGFKALSLICPHLGCIVEKVPSGFACPCHGSRFNADGALQQGPASKPMKNLKTSVNQQGHLILQTASTE